MREQVQVSEAQGHREHWGGVNSIIHRWLMDRQRLIKLYCSLTDNSIDTIQTNQRLEDFCSALVDYLSAGHFEVFTELEKEARHFDERGLQLVNALYPYLEQSTEVALAFNDQCEQHRYSPARLDTVRENLSHLGESLTSRFDLEDQLIEYVHNSSSVVLQ